MTTAKLHYFKGRGRAEIIRWMLAANNINFANISLKDHNDFSLLKNSGKLPFNQLPLLQINDLNLSQSGAIVSYLARLGNFYGDTSTDVVWCDMLFGAIGDFNQPAMQFAFKANKKTASKDLDSSLNKFGHHFEFILNKNGGTFLVGTHLTFVDIILAESLTSFKEFSPDCLENYPLLSSLQESVTSESKISNYLKSTNRWCLPNDQYIIDIARVLRRRLPSHMSNPNRFI